MEPDRITALISTYSSAQYLPQRLDNLLQQTHPALDLWVLDAASPQPEAEIVQHYRSRVQPPRRLYYQRSPERIGLYAAWNRIITQTDNPYLATCNTDDLQHPDYLGRAVALLQQGYDLVWCWWYATRVPHQGWPPLQHDGVVAPEPGGTCGHFPVWRRELHQRYGLLDERFLVLGDAEWWQRLRHHGARIGCIPEPLGAYTNRGRANLYHSARDRDGRRSCVSEDKLLRALRY